MSDKLQFDLTVRVDPKSKKGVGTFVKQVEKKFSAVKLKLDYQKADAQAKKVFERTRAMIDKRAAAEKKAIREETAARVRAQIERQKADKKAHEAFTRMRRAEAKEAEKQEAARIKAAVDRGKAWEAAAKKRQAAEAKQMREGEAHARAIEAEIKQEETLRRKENAKRRKFYADRKALLEDYLHRAKITTIQYNQQDEVAMARHQKRLIEIQREMGNMRLVDMRRLMEIENVMFARHMQKQAQQKQKYTLFGTSFTNKTNQNFFMFQQAIEDFQYAGMRGASNNLAMMASTMGGKGGLIALGTVLGITVLPTIAKATGLVSEEFMDATKAIERVNNSLDRFMNFRKSVFEDSRSKATHGRGLGSMLGDISGGRQDLNFINAETELLRERKALIEGFYRARGAMSSALMLGDVEGVDYRAAAKQLEGMKQALKERHGMSDADLADMEGTGFRGIFTDSAESGVIDPVKERLADLEMEAKLQEKLLQKAKERIGIQARLNRQQAEMDRSLEKQFDTERGINDRSLQGRSSKGYSNLLDDIQFRRSMWLQEVRDEYGTRMNELLFERDSASSPQEKLRVMQQIKSLQEEYYNTISRINGREQGHVDKLNQKRNLIAEMQFHTQEAISNTEKQIEQEKQLQDEIRKRIEQLERARDAQVASFAGANFQSSMTIAGKKFDEDMERFNSQEKQRKMQEDMYLDMMKRMGYDTSGAEQFLEAQREQRQTQFTTGLDKRRRAEQNRLQNQYQGSLERRVAGFANDPERQLEALKELENFQRSRIGSAGSSREMAFFDAQARKTQERILEVMDAQKKKEEEALVESQKRQKVEEFRLKKLKFRMEEISNIDIFSKSTASLMQLMQHLSNIGVDFGGVGAPAAPPAPGGQPQASSAGSVYNVNVAGLPQRPSITAAEMARIAAQQAKAQTMNMGMA